ncbi:hypothetical protein GGI43DRAFT_405119, partial [Trichoderma evansii]
MLGRPAVVPAHLACGIIFCVVGARPPEPCKDAAIGAFFFSLPFVSMTSLRIYEM